MHVVAQADGRSGQEQAEHARNRARGARAGPACVRRREPVGWVSIAPREEFGQLLTSRQYKPREPEEGVYSLVCFYVDPRAKRQGVCGALLDAALEHAKRQRARAVEAYPHASDPRDYMGTVELFKRAGFKPVRKSGKRAIMRFEP